MQFIWRFRKLITIVFCAILIYFGACVVIARMYVNPVRKNITSVPENFHDILISGPGYQIPIWASDGLVQSQKPAKSVFILVHGYSGSRESWSKILPHLLAKGNEVVVPAMRAHDSNPSKLCGFGYHEGFEIVDCIRWIRNRYPKEQPNIILVGTSMGGASCWHASYIEPTISAVISDSSFFDLEEASRSWMRKALPFSTFFYAPVKFLSEFFSGVSSNQVDTRKWISAWKGKPALVIHGANDRLLDMSHATRIANAADCDIWEVPNAKHSSCHDQDPNLYVEKLIMTANKTIECAP